MGPPILNCGYVFAFQCPRTWSALHPTDDESIRMCDRCLKPVHWCRDPEELQRCVAEGLCVAYEDDEQTTTLGSLVPIEE